MDEKEKTNAKVRKERYKQRERIKDGRIKKGDEKRERGERKEERREDKEGRERKREGKERGAVVSDVPVSEREASLTGGVSLQV